MIDSSNLYVYSHDMLLDGIEKISGEVDISQFDPDYIVGISRGGAIPAVYLSHKLKKPITFIEWSSRDKHLAHGQNISHKIIDDLKNGKKVLIVDDIVDGGDTISEIYSELEKNDAWNFNNIRLASLVYNITQNLNVDYHHIKIDRNQESRWFVFPWES